MKQVILTNGNSALVDDEDYARVIAAGNWYEDTSGHGARTYVYRRFEDKKIYLHKFILNYEGPLDIDHLDGEGLNCQKHNLITKSRTANNLNNHNERTDNKSGVRGVYYDSHYVGWKAEIKVKGRKFNLGIYKTVEEAAAARRIAEDRIKNGLPPKDVKTRGSTYTGSKLEDFII